MKGSIILYASQAGPVEALTMEQRGELFTALLAYAGGNDPGPMSSEAAVAFAFFRMQLDMDAAKYADVCRKRSEAGKAGGRPKKAIAFVDDEEKTKKANAFSEKQTKAKKPEDEDDDDSLKEKTIPKGIVEKKSEKRFSAPTVEDVKGYCNEKGLSVDADRFVDFYASKGWRVGNAPMKDWRAAVRNWARQDRTPARQKTNAFKNFEERGNDLDAEMFARIRARREAVG